MRAASLYHARAAGADEENYFPILFFGVTKIVL